MSRTWRFVKPKKKDDKSDKKDSRKVVYKRDKNPAHWEK